MFKQTVSALMLSASFLIAGMTDRAAAQYTTQASYNSGGANMGGGFIEFLFGGHQQQQTSPYHQPYQPPQYAPQAPQYAPQQVQPYQPPQYQRQPMYQEEREQAYEPATPARPDVDPKIPEADGELHGQRDLPAPSSSIRRASFCIWCRVMARRCATASVSVGRASPGPV